MQIHDVIQVAGVIDAAEAELLVECGVRYLGFPLRLAFHAEDLTESQAASIIQALPAECHGVLITYMTDAEEVVTCCRFLGVRIVQLHGDVEVSELQRINQLDPSLSIIKSLVVGRQSTSELQEVMQSSSPFVDAYITDTFDPKTGATGATGKLHDWAISRDIVQQAQHPVILAGGLTPDNVREAIEVVGPAGVDAHTQLEDTTGRKSREKVQQFVAEAKLGFRQRR